MNNNFDDQIIIDILIVEIKTRFLTTKNSITRETFCDQGKQNRHKYFGSQKTLLLFFTVDV